MKRESNQNLSGNEVYYTNSLILLVKHMLCSILDYSKGFDFISFSYKSLTAVGARRARARALRLAARSVPSLNEPLARFTTPADQSLRNFGKFSGCENVL